MAPSRAPPSARRGRSVGRVRAGWVLSREIHDPSVSLGDFGCRRRGGLRKATPDVPISRGMAGPARSETPCTHEINCAEPEIRCRLGGRHPRPHREAPGRTTMTNDDGKSDSSVVPGKSPNKLGNRQRSDGGRGWPREIRPRATRTDAGPGQCASALERVRQAARKDRNSSSRRSCTTVRHRPLRAAYLAIKRDAAAGIDARRGGTTGESGGQPHGPFRTAEARRLPGEASSQNVHPKADGRQRPLGVRRWKTKSSSVRSSR